MSAQEFREKILGLGLSSVIFSNPRNPTGTFITGDELKAWLEVASDTSTALIIDEFYSHYNFTSDRLSISAAEYVEDVEKDPIIILDGLTKNWRYPGFRIAWTLGPREVIESITSGGSFIDGGCAHPLQKAAIKLVSKDIAEQEAQAI